MSVWWPSSDVCSWFHRHAAAGPLLFPRHSAGNEHSHYERDLAELTWRALSIAIRVRIRRFCSDMPGLTRCVF